MFFIMELKKAILSVRIHKMRRVARAQDNNRGAKLIWTNGVREKRRVLNNKNEIQVRKDRYFCG